MTYERAAEIKKTMLEFIEHCNKADCMDCVCADWCKGGDAFLTDYPAGWEIFHEEEKKR